MKREKVFLSLQYKVKLLLLRLKFPASLLRGFIVVLSTILYIRQIVRDNVQIQKYNINKFTNKQSVSE